MDSLKICWLLVLLFMINPAESDECNPGQNSSVAVYPTRSIFVAEGDPVEFVCSLKGNEAINSYNSSHLDFMLVPYESAIVEPINDTSIRFFMEKSIIPNNAGWRYLIHCNLNGQTRCSRSITVGYRPKNVTNFSCISYNRENLTCTWDNVVNSVDTSYHLYYRYGSNQRYCNTTNDNVCGMAPPNYSATTRNYTFTMYTSNYLGNSTQQLGTIDTFAYMIPRPAMDFSVGDIDQYSVDVNWKVSWTLIDFPLIYRITYKIIARWSNDSTHEIAVINSTSEQVSFTADLPYANTEYLISVQARSSFADASNEMLWSLPSELTVKTLPDRPCAPPKASLGSFSVFDVDSVTRKVAIYWSPIEPHCDNGPEVRYMVQLFNSNMHFISEIIANKTSHEFTDLLRSESFTFHIHACNNIGCTDQWATIFVPKSAAMPGAPRNVLSIDYGSTDYEIQWNPPIQNPAINSLYIYNKEYTRENVINSYTIYWCVRDLPSEEEIFWRAVPSTQTSINITVPDSRNYQFAVQTNQGDYSSSLILPYCAVNADANNGKVETRNASVVTNTSMNIEWHLPCSKQNGVVTGFQIYYCMVGDDNAQYGEETVCTGQEMSLQAGPEETNKRIEGLKSYTWYKWSVSVITRVGEGSRSDSLFNRTKEGVPSAPTALQVLHVTNSSISLEWKPPEQPNGNNPSYKILINDTSAQIEETNTVTLENNIMSYTSYVISVQACHANLLCSEPSEPINVRTRIGVPSEPRELKKKEGEKSSEVTFSWLEPSYTAGPLNKYNIKFDYPNYPHTITNIIDLKIDEKIPSSSCPDGRNYTVQIQAVNDNEEGEELFGRWTAPEEYRCPSPGMDLGSVLAITMAVATAVVAIFLGITYCNRRRQLASVAGKTTILLPWEIAPTKQEDRKLSSADLKNGRVQDQKGYHRLQSHTSGSSVVTSTTAVKDVDFEKTSNRISTSSSNDFESDLDSMPSSPIVDSVIAEDTLPSSLKTFQQITTRQETSPAHSMMLDSKSQRSVSSDIQFLNLTDTSPYVRLGDFSEDFTLSLTTESSDYVILGALGGASVATNNSESNQSIAAVADNVETKSFESGVSGYVTISEMVQTESVPFVPTAASTTSGYVVLADADARYPILSEPTVNKNGCREEESKDIQERSVSCLQDSTFEELCSSPDDPSGNVILRIIPTAMKSGGCVTLGAPEPSTQDKAEIHFLLKDFELLTKDSLPVIESVQPKDVSYPGNYDVNSHYVKIDLNEDVVYMV